MSIKLQKDNIGLGKRKEAVARVFLVPGEGNLIINKVVDKFPLDFQMDLYPKDPDQPRSYWFQDL